MQNTENRLTLSHRQNPVTFYLRALLYIMIALFLRVLAFAPLAALKVFPEGSALRWLWLLCPVLVICLILPLRFSFAEALVQPRHERNFSFDKALNLGRYGEKLSEGLLHLLNVAKWGLPLVLMLCGAYYYYTGVDAITLLQSVTALGASVYGLVGLKGGLMEGVYSIAGILAIGVLVWLYGAVRNSAYRYIWAVAADSERNPRTEARRRLRGRRWTQLGVALINLVLWLPALFVVATTLKSVLTEVSAQLMTILSTRKVSLPNMTSALLPLLFAFVVCYLPLLPARRMLTAFFAAKQIHRRAEKGVVVTEGIVGVPSEPAGDPIPETMAEGQPYTPDAAQNDGAPIQS